MRRTAVLAALAVLMALGTPLFLAHAQERATAPDLERIASGNGWRLVGRKAAVFEADGRRGTRLDAGPGDGLATLEGFQFTDGVIEIDLKGRNVQGASFIGVAFRISDDKTYDAVYFRPFNFKNPNEVNRSHGVQYISHPVNTWQKLRNEHPGVYEKPVNPVPESDQWFHARIVVAESSVQVYVNGAAEPCLTVKTLREPGNGRIGLWVGNGSDGTFANLKITSGR